MKELLEDRFQLELFQPVSDQEELAGLYSDWVPLVLYLFQPEPVLP